MEQTEIIAGNTLIHDWMGVKRMKPPFEDQWIGQEKAEDLKYHSDWSWIMPVIEKISRIEFDRRFDEDLDKWVIWTHHPVTFGMLDEYGRPMFRFSCGTLHFGDTLIQAAWLAVVDFITPNNS